MTNQLIPYLTALNQVLQENASNVDSQVYEHDDGEARTVADSKTLTIQSLDNILKELSEFKDNIKTLSFPNFCKYYGVSKA